MRLRDANVQDAPAIADLWNPIIRDTLNTFTTEEKTIIALETAISAAGLENRGYFIAEDAVGLLGFAWNLLGAAYDDWRCWKCCEFNRHQQQ